MYDFIKTVFCMGCFLAVYGICISAGLSPYISIVIILGLIGVIAFNRRKYPSIWQEENIYVVVCRKWNKAENTNDFSYQFCHTYDDGMKVIKDNVEDHIKKLHKPVGCSSNYANVELSDEEGNKWSYQLMKKDVKYSRAHIFDD